MIATQFKSKCIQMYLDLFKGILWHIMWTILYFDSLIFIIKLINKCYRNETFIYLSKMYFQKTKIKYPTK